MSILKENIFFGFFHEDLVAHSGVVPGLISKIARKLHGTRGCGTAGKLQVPSSWHHDRHVGNFSAKTCMIRGPNDFQEWPPEMPWKWWKGHDVFSKKKATFFNPPFFFCHWRSVWFRALQEGCDTKKSPRSAFLQDLDALKDNWNSRDRFGLEEW